MTCRTHIVCSNALALALVQPHDVKSLAVCMGAATVGGIISDLDVCTSDSHRYVDIFCIVTFISLLIIGFLDFKYHIGVNRWIGNNTSYLNIITSSLLLIGVCFYGMHQPHRSFLHSFLGITIMSVLCFFALKGVVIPFLLGLISHICLDIFNKKGLWLLYPIKKKFSLKLCVYNGKVNNILFFIFTGIIVIELFLSGSF